MHAVARWPGWVPAKFDRHACWLNQGSGLAEEDLAPKRIADQFGRRYPGGKAMEGLRRSLSAAFALAVCVAAWPTTAVAQSPAGLEVLKEHLVNLVIDDHNRGLQLQCLGFRLRQADFPLGVELVLTAGHCVNDLKSVQGIDMTVTSPFGSYQGKGRWWLWAKTHDVGYILVQTNNLMSTLLLSYVKYYPQAPSLGTPVIAYIVVGGGAPTSADGLIRGTHDDYVTLEMAGAHGSSGGFVVGRDTGFIVGLIHGAGPGGPAPTPDSAGPVTDVVAASVIFDFTKAHHDELLQKAREIAGR